MFLHTRPAHRISRVFVLHSRSTHSISLSSDPIHFNLDFMERSRCPLRTRQLVGSLKVQHRLRRIDFPRPPPHPTALPTVSYSVLTRESTMPSGLSLSYQQSESCWPLSPARARPTFATDDDTRESTMPSGFPPVSSSELSSTFLCTSETNVCNR
jgi:hypothetical protein